MSGSRKDNAIVLVVQNEIGHADEHVFPDIGIKLAVHFSQDIRRGRIASRFSAQHAPTNRHDQGRRDALARDVSDCHA